MRVFLSVSTVDNRQTRQFESDDERSEEAVFLPHINNRYIKKIHGELSINIDMPYTLSYLLFFTKKVQATLVGKVTIAGLLHACGIDLKELHGLDGNIFPEDIVAALELRKDFPEMKFSEILGSKAA